MYTELYNKDGSLKHAKECKMAFGRKDKNCPRCIELLAGAETRGSWQKDYYAMQKSNEQMALLYKAQHDCKAAGCVVCTAFES